MVKYVDHFRFENLSVAYSDDGYYITDGTAKYLSATFPKAKNLTFEETDEPIPADILAKSTVHNRGDDGDNWTEEDVSTADLPEVEEDA